MPSGQVCTDVVRSGSFPKTFQASQFLSAHCGLTEGFEGSSSVFCSLTMSQPLGVT